MDTSGGGGHIGGLGVLPGQPKYRLNLSFLLFGDVIPEFSFVKYVIVMYLQPVLNPKSYDGATYVVAPKPHFRPNLVWFP